MLAGVLAAFAAGLVWGLVFIVPLFLPDYSGIQLSLGRYTAFGCIALFIAWLDRERLREFTRTDWIMATKLSLVGNIIYYAALASAIQLSGAPLPTMIIGTLPVWIAVTSKLTASDDHGHVAWKNLAIPLTVILAGILLVNASEFQQFNGSVWHYATGTLLSCLAVVAWTWYPVMNSRHLKECPHINSASWSTAQGMTTLPLAIIGFVIYAIVVNVSSTHDQPIFGPTPALFCAVMLFIGLTASWLGTLLWNYASQHLPSGLAGQLIVFETLAALVYAFLFRGQVPDGLVLTGAALLCLGVLLAVRLFHAGIDKGVPT